MEIITPRRIPEQSIMEYSRKREKIFKEFIRYLKEKDLISKFQRAEVAVDFNIDVTTKGVSINPDYFAIYRVEKEIKQMVEQDLLGLLLKVKQQVDF